MTCNTTLDTYATFRTPDQTNVPLDTSSPFLPYMNLATVYIDASTLVGFVVSALGDFPTKLVPSIYPEVVEGYKAVPNVTTNTFLTSHLLAKSRIV